MNNDFNLEESHKKLMELLVSRTLKKHGITKGNHDLSDKEKQNLRELVQHLQQQSELLINSTKNITENDVNPITNTYTVRQENSDH